MEQQQYFFIIDDDENIIKYLKSIIAKVFPKSLVLSANNGLAGWELIKKHGQNAIVISDIIMPEINGLQLLKNVRSEKTLDGTYFMLITGDTDKEQNLKALQMGTDDFIYKPISIDGLIARLRSASRIVSQNFELAEEKRKYEELQNVLQQEIQNMKDLIIKFQQARIPDSTNFVKRVADTSLWIAQQIEEDPQVLKDIENSAYLCNIGRLFLNDKMLNEPVMKKGFTTNKTMTEVPKFAHDLVANVKGFDVVAKNLYYVYENFDGSGIPDGLKGWEIPHGSRILRVVLDYEELLRTKQPQAKVLEQIEHEISRLYDFRVVTYLDQYFANLETTGKNPKEKTVGRRELADGMTLTRAIVTTSGIKIMGAGTYLTTEKIEKILSLTHEDPIIGKIYIRIS